MTGPFRRYEILLPLRFNDGSSVPPDLLVTTLLELRTRFGAVSQETQRIRGIWSAEGQEYEDELVRYFVDAFDSEDNRSYFREFKELLKTRFQQVDIWMTSYPIDVI